MRFRLIFLFALIGMTAAVDAAPVVTLESLLDEMVAMPVPSGVAFTGRLWSSYDRRSVCNDGQAEGWYANHDWSNWLRKERVGAREECVMVDAKGPGAVTRIWTANGHDTVLRLYLDGASEPTWTGLATNFTFGLAAPIPFPLQNSISAKVEPRYRAYNLYLPIPYAKSIRITAELPKPDHRFWYNVETRAYDTTTEVESLSPSVLIRAEHTIKNTVGKLISQGKRKGDSLSGSGVRCWKMPDKVLKPGARSILKISIGPAAVCALQGLGKVRLQMAFDEEETVDLPNPQFANCGSACESFLSQFVMPFASNCTMTVANEGAEEVDLSGARVWTCPYAWNDHSLHFGAYGFSLTNLSTRVGSAGYYDIPWLELEGEGCLVGHSLILENHADYAKAAWWGEGDEKIYVDGESFPSYFGTGTEDFFGYAWGPNREYDASPFLSMPVADGEPDAQGRHRAAMWRLRKLDIVPFKKSVRLDVEMWHWQDATMDYAPATFWYARPGAKKNPKIVPIPVPATPLPNVSSMWTVWNGRTVAWSQVRNEAYPFPFVEWVELMAATGGNPERDCLKDPGDRTVLDDYDFASLIEVCRGILAMGAKPYLKLGGVPSKFTENPDGGSFRTNVRPPTDPLVHYRYMRACAAALRAAFGRDVVRSWRFAVLTESDNFAWFKSVDGDLSQTREAFFSLYDYTVRAFQEELGEGLIIGTHLLDPHDNRDKPFTAVDLARHCLCGTNAATGGIGTQLRLLTFSNYIEPGVNGPRGPNKFGKIAEALRDVKALGFTNLVTGIDEGRVIWGAKGSVKRDLHARAVGQSYQAAYDVRLAKTAYDLGFDYAATWGWFSGPESWEGLPSHHYFTQREIAKFAGMNRLEIDRATDLGLDVVAAVSADGKKVRAMVGFLTDDLNATNRFEGAVRLHLPPSFVNRRVTCRTLTLDDRNNWFCDWQSDRKRLGIKDDDFIWSPDGFSPLAGRGLKNPEHRRLFAEELQPRYAEKAKSIRPFESTVEVSSAAVLELPLVFRGNSAVFVDLD